MTVNCPLAFRGANWIFLLAGLTTVRIVWAVTPRFHLLLVLENTAKQPSHRLAQQGYVLVLTYSLTCDSGNHWHVMHF